MNEIKTRLWVRSIRFQKKRRYRKKKSLFEYKYKKNYIQFKHIILMTQPSGFIDAENMLIDT